MTDARCSHKFVDSKRCLRCGVHVDDLRKASQPVSRETLSATPITIRRMLPEQHAAMREYLEFVQREPLPATDAATRQRLDDAAERWPQIAALLGGWRDEDTTRQCARCMQPEAECRCIANGR